MGDGLKRRALRVVGESSDDDLMEALKGGDMAPLAELYLRHGGMVSCAVRRFAPEISMAEAEEIGQDVFLALAQSASRYKGSERFRAWLYGIAVNKVRRWRRSTWLRRNLLERHHKDPVGVFAVKDADPDREAQERDELRQALTELSPDQREVLLLHAVEGFTGEEIARILGIRPKTVWTRLHRARKAMTKMLAPGEAVAAKRPEGS